MYPVFFWIFFRVIAPLKAEGNRAGCPQQAGVKNDLCNGENVQNFMGAHQFVGIAGVQTGNNLPLETLKKIQSLPEQRLAFDAAAVVLHRLGDRAVQFFPVGSLFGTDRQRRQKPFFLRRGLFRIVRQKFCPGAVGGGFSSGIVAGRAGKSRTVRCIQLVARRIDAVNVCLQIPVVQDPAGRAEELALLFQEIRGLPAGPVALQPVFFRIKSTLGIVLQDRYLRLRFLADHHSPDHLPLHPGHPAQVRVKRQLISSPHQFVKIQGLRSAVFILWIVDDAAFQEKFLSRRRAIPLGKRGQFPSVSVHIGNLHTSGVHHRSRIPCVVIVSGPVRRKTSAGSGKLCPDRFFHHGEFYTGFPAHRMAASDAGHRAELAKSGEICVKQPDSRRAGHAEDRRPGPENIKLSGMHIHAESAHSDLFPIADSREQRGCLGPLVHPDAETFQFPVQRRFERAAPYAQRKPVLIIVGKHQPCLLIPELRPAEFSLRIPDLPAETFQIQQPIVPFPAFNIVSDPIAVPVLLPHICPGDLFRRHFGAWVGTGRFPVVKSCSRGAAALHGAFFHQHDILSPPGRRNGGKTSRQATSEHQHIAEYCFLLPGFIGVGPCMIHHFHHVLFLLIAALLLSQFSWMNGSLLPAYQTNSYCANAAQSFAPASMSIREATQLWQWG